MCCSKIIDLKPRTLLKRQPCVIGIRDIGYVKPIATLCYYEKIHVLNLNQIHALWVHNCMRLPNTIKCCCANVALKSKKRLRVHFNILLFLHIRLMVFFGRMSKPTKPVQK